MTAILASVALVAVFIIIGGVFAAAEIALVTLRDGQVRSLEERGGRGLAVVRLVAEPNRFLAAVQIGVTLAGFLSAAFGEATLSGHLAPVLGHLGLPDWAADVLATLLITIVISYFAIVFSELTPKRLGLQRGEGIAVALGPMLERIAGAARPAIWLLSKSTDLAVRVLGGDPDTQREAMTEEELRDIVTAHDSLSGDERRLISEVFGAGDRQIREVMVPRTEVDFLDAALPLRKAAGLVADSPHSRFPVYRGTHDTVIGFLHVRDLFSAGDARDAGSSVGDLVRPVSLLPDGRTVLAAMSDLRRAGQHIAVVVDEYGGTAGIVTLEDLIEELVGEIRDEYDPEAGEATRLAGGDLVVSGLLNLDEFAEATGHPLPEGPYETAAGCVQATLGRLPELGDEVEIAGLKLAVTELDGRRISRIRVSALPPAPAEPPAGTLAE